MKRLLCAAIACWILASGTVMAAPTADPDAVAGKYVEAAGRFIDRLAAGHFAEAVASMDPEMQKLLTADRMKEAWNGMPAQIGEFRGHGIGVKSDSGHGVVVSVPLNFQKAALRAKFSYDKAGLVAGLHFLPPPPAPPEKPREDPKGFREQAITLGLPGWLLPGTLTLPATGGPFPVLVLVHGSGPNDRDETVGGVKIFRDLASGLASKGIAVLRYDKRTLVHGERLVGTPITVAEETVDDAVAAVEFARGIKEVDPKRVFLLGHSLGGYLAPRIGLKNQHLAGLIFMEGAARPVEELVVEQTRYIMEAAGVDAATRAKGMAGIEEVARQIRDPGLAKKDPKAMIFYAPPAYWLNLRGYNPASMAAKLPLPLLIIQGGRDYQVTEKDFNIYKGALSDRKDVTFKLYPKTNHLGVEGEGKSVPSEYDVPAYVSAGLIADIAGWIQGIHPK